MEEWGRAALAFGAGREDHRCGSHGLPDADGVHWGLHIPECVADREGFGFKANGITRIPACASRVDVEIDWLLWIIEFQIKKLSNDQLSDIDAHLTFGIVIGKEW